MSLAHRELDQSSFGADQNLYLWADDGELAVRFVIPHLIFVDAFHFQPPDRATDRFWEVLIVVRAACDWAYEREKHGLKSDSLTADIVVTPEDFSKARKWLATGTQGRD
jgi:hypothetical protein